MRMIRDTDNVVSRADHWQQVDDLMDVVQHYREEAAMWRRIYLRGQDELAAAKCELAEANAALAALGCDLPLSGED